MSSPIVKLLLVCGVGVIGIAFLVGEASVVSEADGGVDDLWSGQHLDQAFVNDDSVEMELVSSPVELLSQMDSMALPGSVVADATIEDEPDLPSSRNPEPSGNANPLATGESDSGLTPEQERDLDDIRGRIGSVVPEDFGGQTGTGEQARVVHPSQSAIDQARALVHQNIVHILAPGYRVNEFVLAEDEDGVLQVNSRLKTDAGQRRITNNPLDISLATGWFRVTRQDQDFYTRNGQFHIGKTGNVTLSVGEKSYDLSPVITIPAESTDITVAADGKVSIRLAGEGPEVSHDVGMIEVYECIDASQMKRFGATLLIATDASGPMRLVHPDARQMRSGMLELPNSTLVEQQDTLRYLDTVEETLADSAVE